MLRDTFTAKIPTEEEFLEPTDDSALELPIDLIRIDDTLVVRAPIVGVDLNGVTVTLGNNRLTLRKTSHDDPLTNPDRIYLEECHWGELVRTIDLPLPVNPNTTRATLHSGVLTITMPLLNPNLEKLIKIKE